MAQPSREDPLVAASSEGIGGPVGTHARGHRWWTPVRVVLAVVCLTFALGMVQKGPCVQANWTNGNLRYAQMCYSDVPYLYAGRGFAELHVPYADSDGRYAGLEYPAVIGYFAYAAAWVTQQVAGTPDDANRDQVPVDQMWSAPGVAQESGLYFIVTAVGLGLATLLAGYFMAGAHRGRPWDAMLFAASPMLLLAGLINWDLLAVALVAGACWAWARDRPILSGALIGLGIATKLYPLLLIGALFCVCLRSRRLRDFGLALNGAVLAWLVVNLPAMLYGFDQWKSFWGFNADRGADLGSVWLVWEQMGHQITSDTINTVQAIWMVGCCVAVLVLSLVVRRTPRIAQLGFVLVCCLLLVNKVYSPQYVLWLLPLAVLARPRWRDILIWQAGELVYFCAVWLHLGDYLAPAVQEAPDRVYWLAIGVRVAAELYLLVMVLRDIVAPSYDPARIGPHGADPMWPGATSGGPARRGHREAEPSTG